MILKCCIRCRLTISPPMAPLRYSRIANRRRGSAIRCGAFGDWFAHDNSNLQHVLLFVEQNAFNGKALHAAMKQLLRHRGDESILMLSARTLANPHSAFNISPRLVFLMASGIKPSIQNRLRFLSAAVASQAVAPYSNRLQKGWSLMISSLSFMLRRTPELSDSGGPALSLGQLKRPARSSDSRRTKIHQSTVSSVDLIGRGTTSNGPVWQIPWQ